MVNLSKDVIRKEEGVLQGCRLADHAQQPARECTHQAFCKQACAPQVACWDGCAHRSLGMTISVSTFLRSVSTPSAACE